MIAEDADHVIIEAGAGENWHELVRWTIRQGYSGLENLSLIPGLVGAAPMQNIGAYGVELAAVLESVTAWDWRKAVWKTFSAHECGFSYRDSRFKSVEPDRYLITSVGLRLNRTFHPILGYAGLQDELDGAPATPERVSNAVISLRRRKLPDPGDVGNAGSFFKNPIVSQDEAEALRTRFDGLPTWPDGADRAKVSAGWMIEYCGLKGATEGDAAVSTQHALVLVNQGAASGSEVLALAERIRATVDETFGVLLEVEPKLVTFATRDSTP